MTTFLTGSASVFGIPAKAAAEILVDDINAAGGIGGVKIKPIFIDEGVGIDKLLSEYRRVVQEAGVKVTFAAISSGNCNALAPVAEDQKVLNVMWDCASEKILETRRYKYVARTVGNGTSEVVATVLHLLRTKPDFKTLAIVNQDYAWGHDSRVLFMNALRAIKPDVKLVAEMYPKFGATDFSSEISRLQALAPDVILSTSWGGDLDTLVRQASQRGLTRTSTWVLAVELGPDGIRVNAICPVIGETNMTHRLMGVADTPENRARFLATIPLGRYCRPSDVAAAALYLASDAAEFVTGVEFPVDGGRTA